MNWQCIIACLTTHILTKILYNKSDELNALKTQLYDTKQQINNYRESGAIEKIYVKTYPNETIGIKSTMYHSILVTPEEAEKTENVI